MTRRLIAVLALVLLPLFAYAQHQAPAPADSVAHGSEKAAHEAAHPAEEHGGAHEEPKFLGLPAWIFKLINMLMFIGLLVYLIGGPVKNALASRSENIRKDAETARTRREKSAQVADEIRDRLAQLEDELRSIEERARHEGERQKNDLIAAAEAEAAKILATARAEVDNRLKHARAELTEYAGELASQRAAEILRDRITPDDQRKLFRESVEQVNEVKS